MTDAPMTSSNPLLANLNTEQLQAVTLPPTHALILAGAGSGKTRVLTTRIAWLVSTGQVGPHGVLAVTFTNKAAKEMLARLSAMLPMDFRHGTRSMWIGTFHGLCNRLLRAHHRDAGLPQLFQILDSADQLSAIKRLVKNLNIDDEKFPPRELMYFINSAKEQGLRPHEVEAWDDFTRRRVELYTEYERQCQREGVVDFAELLLRSYELLERNEVIRAHYQRRFAHILVDEFQDTNVLQYRWLKLLASGGAKLFAVGDDDQSIYRFRGAEVGNMRDFEREFHVDTVIRLEQNYRSHGNILDAANAIIKHNAGRLGKNLWTDRGEGEPIRVFEAPDDGTEARFVTEEIRSLTNEGVSRAQIALLYRSNAQSRVLEHQLFAAGIPYRVYGGLRFFERQEVKHALAYLRLIANPHDDTAFARVINFPPRGIGARSQEQLQDAAKAQASSLYGAVAFVPGKAGQVVAGFVRLVDQMRFGCEGLTLPEMVEQVLELSSLRSHYATEKEGQDRLANLDELINAAANFIAEEGLGTELPEGEARPDPLSAFLAHASLEAGDHQADAGQDAVQLMTVHSAKGLEFDVVFLGGLEEGLFPHENSMNDEGGLEEERRLMYVAVTRARNRLYVTFSQQRMLHGQTRYNVRSRFVDEIPEHLVKWLTPPRKEFGFGAFANNAAPPWGGAPSAGVAAAPGRRGSPRNDLGGFRIGQTVIHAKFGHGVIVNAEGAGGDARVQVNFGREGMKWLALAVAKLTPA